MLEAAIGDGADEFRLQQEVLEAGGVDASIAAFGGDLASSVACLPLSAVGGGGRGGGGGADVIVGVVDEVFLGVRHVDSTSG
jgi:hypothetical protein